MNKAIALPDNSFIQNSVLKLPEKTKYPGDSSISPYPTKEVSFVTSDNSSSSGSDRSWQVGEPIIEPQGVYQLPDGQLVLSRECSE